MGIKNSRDISWDSQDKNSQIKIYLGWEMG